MIDEQDTARRLAKAIWRGLTRSAYEMKLDDDVLCAALLGALVERAEAACVPRLRLSEWLRDVADGLEHDEGGPFKIPSMVS